MSTSKPKRAIAAGRYGAKMANTKVHGKDGCLHRLSFPLYSVKLYEARERKKDGAITWRFVKHLSEGHTWFPTVLDWAEKRAAEEGLDFEPGLTHGTVETPAPPPPEPASPPPIVWAEDFDDTQTLFD